MLVRRAVGIVALGVAGALLVWWPEVARPGPPGRRAVTIEVSSSAFRPAVVALEPGDTATIELVATDVVHGLYLESYGLMATAEPGRPARLTLVANRRGSFRFRCPVTCGPLHPFILGRLEVGPHSVLWRWGLLGVLAVAAGWWLGRR